MGHRLNEGVEQATDGAKEKLHQAGHRAPEGKGACGSAKTTAEVRQHVGVIGSCGNRLGRVDHLEAGSIKLTRKDTPDGQHHYLPLTWVAPVDEHVHLSKNRGEAWLEWNAAPIRTGGG